MKIRLITQNPLSVGYGGLEMQAQHYINCIKKTHSEVDIGFFDWTETDIDILHVLGLLINPYRISILKSKNTKIVVSPVFYLKADKFFDFKRPTICKIGSCFPYTSFNWMRKLVQNADVLLPNSQDEGKQLVYTFSANKDKINVLYNGVLKDYYKGASKDLFRDKYNLNNYILCCAHIDPRKNQTCLIKGFLKYKKLHPESDLKLVILGQYRGNYVSYNKAVKNLISSSNDILHIDNLKNSDALFKSAYLGCSAHFLLSALETPGLSNIEAGLAGKKLVLGDCKPVREYFKGYADYINPHNMNEIVKSIENLDLHSENKEEMNFISENYTRETIAEKLLKIYTELGNTK